LTGANSQHKMRELALPLPREILKNFIDDGFIFGASQ
jgi:hypothetical protein